MKCICDTWYVSIQELVNQCGFTEKALYQGMWRKASIWQFTSDPDNQHRKLIRYDTMAPDHQAIVRLKLCKGLEPWEIKAQKQVDVLSERSISELVELAVMEGFRRYLGLYPTVDTSRNAQKTQTCLARAAAVVETIGAYIQHREYDERSYTPYKEAEAWFKQDGNYDYYFPEGNQYLPLNPIRLKEKVVLRFGKPGTEPLPITEVIKLPRKGNKSRDKFASDKELMAWIAMARKQGTNDPNAYIIRKVSEVCRIVGREVPSASWFSQVLATGKMKQMTADGRFGNGTKLAGRYTHSITMARAMYAGDCWMMDATRVNMIEHVTGDKGKSAFMFVIAVRDAYSGDVVGVHFDTKEDRWSYVNALKMAVKSTGYLPHTLVYDRFPGHMADEMKTILANIEAKGVNLVCTHKATGKALLERWWDTLQTVFFSNSKYYYGEGIRSTRSYAHRSPEYLAKLRKEAVRDGWDFDQAWQEAWTRIEEYRQTPLSHYSRVHKNLNLSPAQLHSQSERPNVINLEVWDQAGLFWMTKVLDIRRNRLEHEVHGTRYEYQIYNKEWLYRYQRVAIRYEESDPSKIMLFAVGADDQVSDFYIGELSETAPIAMYGPDADKGRLAGRMEKIKQFEQAKKADLDETISHATVDPEYLLNLSRYTSKTEQESLETGLIYEQMGVTIAADAHRPAKDKKPKERILPAASDAQDFDTSKWINDSFYDQ